MEIYVTCDFVKTLTGSFLRKPSLADTSYIKRETALSESRYYVEFTENQCLIEDVTYFVTPCETPSYIVLGSYIRHGEKIYFGVGKEYLVER